MLPVAATTVLPYPEGSWQGAPTALALVGRDCFQIHMELCLCQATLRGPRQALGILLLLRQLVGWRGPTSCSIPLWPFNSEAAGGRNFFPSCQRLLLHILSAHGVLLPQLSHFPEFEDLCLNIGGDRHDWCVRSLLGAARQLFRWLGGTALLPPRAPCPTDGNITCFGRRCRSYWTIRRCTQTGHAACKRHAPHYCMQRDVICHQAPHIG